MTDHHHRASCELRAGPATSIVYKVVGTKFKIHVTRRQGRVLNFRLGCGDMARWGKGASNGRNLNLAPNAFDSAVNQTLCIPGIRGLGP